jgi:hypothetical protein
LVAGALGEGLAEEEAEAPGATVGGAVPLLVADTEGVGELLLVALPVLLSVLLPLALAAAGALGVALAEGVGWLLGDGVGEPLCVCEPESLLLAVALPVPELEQQGVTVALPVPLPDALPDPLPVPLPVPLPDRLLVGEGLPLPVPLSLAVGEAVVEGVAVPLRVGERDGVGEDVTPTTAPLSSRLGLVPPELKYRVPAAAVAPQATRRNVTLCVTLCSAAVPLKATAGRAFPPLAVEAKENEAPRAVKVPPMPYCHCAVPGPVAERLRL